MKRLTFEQMQFVENYRQWLQGATVRNPVQSLEKYLKVQGYDLNAPKATIEYVHDEEIRTINDALKYAIERCEQGPRCEECPLNRDYEPDECFESPVSCCLPFVKEYFDKNKLCIIKKED